MSGGFGFYNDIKKVVFDLINFFTPSGNNAVWVKPISTTPDPNKPWRQEKTTQETPFRLVYIESQNRLQEFNRTQFFDERELSKSTVFGIFHPQGFEVELDDVCVHQDQNLRVTAIQRYAPENEVLVWIIGFN